MIKGLGDILKRQKRTTDVVARFGGEEFVVLCEQTDEAGAMLLGERIREELEKTVFHTPTGPLSVTCSVGIATFPEAGQTWDELFKAADEALYVLEAHGPESRHGLGAGIDLAHQSGLIRRCGKAAPGQSRRAWSSSSHHERRQAEAGRRP